MFDMDMGVLVISCPCLSHFGCRLSAEHISMTRYVMKEEKECGENTHPKFHVASSRPILPSPLNINKFILAARKGK
jgi:hypothetical protein